MPTTTLASASSVLQLALANERAALPIQPSRSLLTRILRR